MIPPIFIIFGKISTGALSDLERITKMAYSIVSVYGMNKNIGNLSFFDSKQSDYNFTKPYSDSTAEKIDQEVKRIIDNKNLKLKDILITHHHFDHTGGIAALKEIMELIGVLFQQ